MKKTTISIFMMLIIFSSCDIADKLNKTADSDGNSSEINFQVASDAKANKAYYYEYEVNFPKLATEPENAKKQIKEAFNSEITKFIESYLKNYDKTSLVEKKKIVDIIIAEDSITAKENSMVYHLNISYLTNETTAGLLSVKFIIESFDLGAHGNTYFKTFNFNLKTGDFLTVDDLLNVSSDEDIAKLDKLISKNFDNPLNCFDTTPKVSLKDMQFSVTEENAVFSYQPYILGAYTCGSSTILIPISELKEAGLWKNK